MRGEEEDDEYHSDESDDEACGEGIVVADLMTRKVIKIKKRRNAFYQLTTNALEQYSREEVK